MAASHLIDWESNSSHLFMNPRYSPSEKECFMKILDLTASFKAHVWLSTSGSRAPKWVGLSKKAILASAQAVNQHLQSHHFDRWVSPLPDFHIGGLGIWARSYLTRATIFDFKTVQEKWDPKLFYHYVYHVQGTLTALVPAQLFDLIQLQLQSPPSLRAVIVGGGALSKDLYEKALALKWKVLPSYGLTECASQVATAELGSWNHHQFPALKILPHLEVKIEKERVCFKGSSLLTAYAIWNEERCELVDPKSEGWLSSEDKGIIEKEDYLTLLGRVDQQVKIGGENVDIFRLEMLLCDLKLELNIPGDMTLIVRNDARLGHAIYLIADLYAQHAVEPVKNTFNLKVLPFERIKEVYIVDKIPRSPLAKVKREELLKKMG